MLRSKAMMGKVGSYVCYLLPNDHRNVMVLKPVVKSRLIPNSSAASLSKVIYFAASTCGAADAAANFSAQRMRPVICITSQSVTDVY